MQDGREGKYIIVHLADPGSSELNSRALEGSGGGSPNFKPMEPDTGSVLFFSYGFFLAILSSRVNFNTCI